jgi:hypothetical protein
MYIYENPETGEKGERQSSLILASPSPRTWVRRGPLFLGDGYSETCAGVLTGPIFSREKLLESVQVILMQIEPFMSVCNI